MMVQLSQPPQLVTDYQDRMRLSSLTASLKARALYLAGSVAMFSVACAALDQSHVLADTSKLPAMTFLKL